MVEIGRVRVKAGNAPIEQKISAYPLKAEICAFMSHALGKQIARRASTCVRHTIGKKSKNYKINHSLALQRLNLRFLLSYRSYQVERTHRALNGRLRRLAASCTAADRRHCDRCVP